MSVETGRLEHVGLHVEDHEREQPDLILLDVMLPKLDGLEVCRILRGEMNVPVIMLTARAQTEDRIQGLEAGADDYLTKPFSPKELLLRVQSVLRRAGGRKSLSSS